MADDQHHLVFMAEETRGIRVFGAEPGDSTEGKFIVQVGEHGITGDLEGMSLVPTGETSGYLIVSDQGRSKFLAFDRKPPHRFLGSFALAENQSTDGLDVTLRAVENGFAKGTLGYHTDHDDDCYMVLQPWSAAMEALKLAN